MTHRHRTFQSVGSLTVLLAGLVSNIQAETFIESVIQGNSAVWRVEEVWEARISNPDAGLCAPHITTTFSANGSGVGQHCIVNINHVTLDYFQPGGVQLQVWDGEEAITHKKVPWQKVLETPNEVITWTQGMTHLGESIIYQITDGHSNTWGDFGGQGFLTAMVDATTPNLDLYTPQFSVENSGAVYAGNRVSSLKLVSVTVFTIDGQEIHVPLNLAVTP